MIFVQLGWLVKVKIEVDSLWLSCFWWLYFLLKHFRTSGIRLKLSLYLLLRGLLRSIKFHHVKLFIDEILYFIVFLLLLFPNLDGEHLIHAHLVLRIHKVHRWCLNRLNCLGGIIEIKFSLVRCDKLLLAARWLEVKQLG